MKRHLSIAAVLVALAAGLGLAAYSGSAPVHPLLELPLLVAGIALPTGLVRLLYWPFRNLFLIVPIIATVALAVLFSFGVSGYLLGLRGETRTATVTEYTGRGVKGNGHTVRLSGEDGREFPGDFLVSEPYAPGTRVAVVVDPHGWAPATLATDPRPGAWFPWTAGGAFGLVGGLYVLGIVRERSKGPG